MVYSIEFNDDNEDWKEESEMEILEASIFLFFQQKYCRHSMCCCQMITTADSNIQTNWKEINIRHSERKIRYYQYHHHQIPWFFFEIISLLFESLVASEKKTNIRFNFNSSRFSIIIIIFQHNPINQKKRPTKHPLCLSSSFSIFWKQTNIMFGTSQIQVFKYNG